MVLVLLSSLLVLGVIGVGGVLFALGSPWCVCCGFVFCRACISCVAGGIAVVVSLLCRRLLVPSVRGVPAVLLCVAFCSWPSVVAVRVGLLHVPCRALL